MKKASNLLHHIYQPYILINIPKNGGFYMKKTCIKRLLLSIAMLTSSAFPMLRRTISRSIPRYTTTTIGYHPYNQQHQESNDQEQKPHNYEPWWGKWLKISNKAMLCFGATYATTYYLDQRYTRLMQQEGCLTHDINQAIQNEDWQALEKILEQEITNCSDLEKRSPKFWARLSYLIITLTYIVSRSNNQHALLRVYTFSDRKFLKTLKKSEQNKIIIDATVFKDIEILQFYIINYLGDQKEKAETCTHALNEWIKRHNHNQDISRNEIDIVNLLLNAGANPNNCELKTNLIETIDKSTAEALKAKLHRKLNE